MRFDRESAQDLWCSVSRGTQREGISARKFSHKTQVGSRCTVQAERDDFRKSEPNVYIYSRWCPGRQKLSHLSSTALLLVLDLLSSSSPTPLFDFINTMSASTLVSCGFENTRGHMDFSDRELSIHHTDDHNFTIHYRDWMRIMNPSGIYLPFALPSSKPRPIKVRFPPRSNLLIGICMVCL